VTPLVYGNKGGKSGVIAFGGVYAADMMCARPPFNCIIDHRK
jgi:hypothetical protein